MNLTEITAIVRGYLTDNSAVVTQPIIDSVNFLSNLFFIDSIDESQATVIDEDTLDIPTLSIDIDKVFLDGEEVRKLKQLDDLETVREQGTVRWYVFNSKIQFTIAFTAVVSSKIWYKKGYIEPTAGVDTDVPVELLELVYIGAQYRYYNLLISKLVLNKSDLPDINPDELRKIRNDVKNHYFEIVKTLQMNNSHD